MKEVEFAQDWRYRRDPHSRVQYRKGQSLSISEEAYEAAKAAGVLKEEANARSGNRGPARGSDPAEE